MHHRSKGLPQVLEQSLSLRFGSGSPVSSHCPVQVNSALQKLLSSSAMNPPWGSNFCKGRGATHQPPDACTALQQDKGLYLAQLSLGQMSKKSLLSFLWLNHYYTKKLNFHRRAGKSTASRERVGCCLRGTFPFLTSQSVILQRQIKPIGNGTESALWV